MASSQERIPCFLPLLLSDTKICKGLIMAFLASPVHRQTFTWPTRDPAAWAATGSSESRRHRNACRGCTQGLGEPMETRVWAENALRRMVNEQWADIVGKRCHSKITCEYAEIVSLGRQHRSTGKYGYTLRRFGLSQSFALS